MALAKDGSVGDASSSSSSGSDSSSSPDDVLLSSSPKKRRFFFAYPSHSLQCPLNPSKKATLY